MPLKSSDNFVVGIGTADDAIAKYINSTEISTVQNASYSKEDIFTQDSGAVARSESKIVSPAYAEGTVSSYATPEVCLFFLRNLIGQAKAAPSALSSPTRYQYTSNFTTSFAKQDLYLWMRENDNQVRRHKGSFSEVTFDITPEQTVRIAGTWNSEGIADNSLSWSESFADEDIPYTLTSSVRIRPLNSSGVISGAWAALDFSSCSLTLTNNLTPVPTSGGRTLRNGQLDAEISVSKDQLDTSFFDASVAESAYLVAVTIQGNSTDFFTTISFPAQIGEYTEDRTRGEDIAETVPFVFAPSRYSSANKIAVSAIALTNNL